MTTAQRPQSPNYWRAAAFDVSIGMRFWLERVSRTIGQSIFSAICVFFESK
jgi:hypothetical protein